jgi:hypothetical protein
MTSKMIALMIATLVLGACGAQQSGELGLAARTKKSVGAQSGAASGSGSSKGGERLVLVPVVLAPTGHRGRTHGVIATSGALKNN